MVKLPHPIPDYTAETHSSKEGWGNQTGTTELDSWGIGREVRKRKRFYHAAKCNPTPENECRLYNQRRVVKKMVQQAKVAEEHRVALECHDNPKEFFGYVNKHKPRAPLSPVFSADGHLLTNDEEMDREFNTYFSNVFTVEDIDNIPDPVIVQEGENT